MLRYNFQLNTRKNPEEAARVLAGIYPIFSIAGLNEYAPDAAEVDLEHAKVTLQISRATQEDKKLKQRIDAAIRSGMKSLGYDYTDA